VDPRVLRAFINKSGDTIRWLQKQGMDIELSKTLYPNQPRVTHIAADGGGAKVIKALVQKCKDFGIRLLVDTGAQKISRGANGDVTGVIATNAQGKKFKIKTGSIIIATGGFGGNKELLRTHSRSYYEGMRLDGFAHNGDGILMAGDIGAAIADSIPILKEGPVADCGGENITLKSIVKEANTVWVNKKGKRFTDETTGFMTFISANPVLQQPDKISYTLFDTNIVQDWINNAVPMLMGKTPRGGIRIKDGRSMPKFDKQLRTYQDTLGVVKVANSWEEIAGWIGADPGVLKSTIDEYNSFCDSGYDAMFAKHRKYLQKLNRPPYYAVRCVTVFIDTLGGIKVSENMEVLNKQGNNIPGLYAAGVTADGFESETYCSELAGSALGFALNSGRIAGENAAKFICKPFGK
jgi:fumarate reductase flavoprotein subunit